ncbi:DUF6415 family natural product biosynthesis protein [Streptomyces niveus]|uniref:DUF6415 family natural product biosynthesis protein n=1 Tax=Streptomyces niveus TaxID=193462 RepID=UPI0036CC0259
MHLAAAERAAGLRHAWQASGTVPGPAVIREITGSLRTVIHRLLPGAERHRAELAPGGDAFEVTGLIITRARALAAENLPADPVTALEHALELSASAGQLQALTEQPAALALVLGDTPAWPP